MNSPKVSIIMASYNRARTLGRAIDSVLRQDIPDWELIIVDDASPDNSREVIEGYVRKDARIRATFHQRNLHVNAARNTGFDLMRGEWFTLLDNDDEMTPKALSTMLHLAESLKPTPDAITCNCLDTTTGHFSGRGLERDQWLDFDTLACRCSGEHWGITKRSLLGGERFNTRMRGAAEGILWWRISRNAKRYYLHQALRIFHTEGADRQTKLGLTVNLDDAIGYYIEMATEAEHLKLLKHYRPTEYSLVQRNIALAMATAGRCTEAWKAYREAKSHLPVPQRLAVIFALLGGRLAAQAVVKAGAKVRRQAGSKRKA